MRHAVRFLGLTTFLSVLGALALPHAHATVMVAVPLEELVATSDAIVHARVVRVGTRLVLRDDGTMQPHTLSELRVTEWLRGAPLEANATDVIVDEIDREEGVAIARSRADAPEIDGNVFIDGDIVAGLSVGDIVNVAITDASEYDLYAR